MTPTFIQAIPWEPRRAAQARHLSEVTDGTVVWDTTHHAFDTWRSVLTTIGNSAAIILEDDVIVCDDWRTKVEAVIREYPEVVIQFFSMRGDDLTVGSRWQAGRTFLMNQCYYLPEGAAKALLEYTQDWAQRHPEHPTGYDVAMAEWLKVTKQKYWTHVPSLVQHQPWRSEINPRRPRNRQSRTFA